MAWLPTDVEQKTFGVTTQFDMGSFERLPLRQHFKSRFPQLNVPRLSETFATDTLFASVDGIGGITCAQIFTGTRSKFTQIFGLKTESEGPEALEDFIRNFGAPYALRSDNAKMQTSHLFNKIMRKYNIKAEYTEPHHPQQNPAERRIQDIKCTTAKVMDRTGTPEFLWFYAMSYVTQVLNHTALESLKGITPLQACYGVTPDISALLQFHFYEPIYYYEEASFPATEEKFGHWLGVAENQGDALTYFILAENNQILSRSLVRPITDTEKNLRCPVSTEQNDPEVAVIEGSNDPDVSSDKLRLLSVAVNSITPEFDPSQVNGSVPDLSKFIGAEFNMQ